MKGLFRSRFFKVPEHRQFTYVPQYYDIEEEERQEMFGHKDIKLERGAFFKQSTRLRITEAFRNDDYIFRERQSKVGRFMRLLLLMGMLSLAALYLIGKIQGVIAISLLLFLTIIFVSKVNNF